MFSNQLNYTIAHLFCVTRSTVCELIHETVQSYQSSQSNTCTFRQGLLDDVIWSFESKWGFPQCAGTIDGSHITVCAGPWAIWITKITGISKKLDQKATSQKILSGHSKQIMGFLFFRLSSGFTCLQYKLNRDQRTYNYWLSRACIEVENTFGRQKANFVAAYCVLHNIWKIH